MLANPASRYKLRAKLQAIAKIWGNGLAGLKQF